MPTKQFANLQGIKKMITVPSYVFDDERVSLGAKGLYVQIIYSNNNASILKDFTQFANVGEKELESYFNELAEYGYVEFKDSQTCKVLSQPPKSKVDKQNVENAKEYAKTEAPPQLNIYEKMEGIVNGFDLPVNTKQALIVYFTKRLNKQGRFANAPALHKYLVQSLVSDLVSFHLNEEDQIACVQLSTDKEWFKFFRPSGAQTVNTPTPAPRRTSFDTTAETISGSYTEEDIKALKERAKALEQGGDVEVF